MYLIQYLKTLITRILIIYDRVEWLQHPVGLVAIITVKNIVTKDCTHINEFHVKKMLLKLLFLLGNNFFIAVCNATDRENSQIVFNLIFFTSFHSRRSIFGVI